MTTFLLRRIALIVPTLFFVSLLIFGLQQLLPGDPATALAGEDRDPAVIAFIRQKYHLDEPLPVRYALRVKGVAQGDAAGARDGLRPHRARQGTPRDPGDPAARLPQRADPGCDLGGAGFRRAALRRGLDRAGVHDPRVRQIDRRRRIQSRLRGRAGRRLVHRLRIHPAEPLCRLGLCRVEPAAAHMTAQTLDRLSTEEALGEPPWLRALRRL